MSDLNDERPDYEVGYGKPPKASRWTKGQSGNPKGRKKGSRSLKKDLDEALNTVLTVTVNGKKREGTTQQHAMYALAVKAAAGDMRASKQLVDLILVIFGADERGGKEAKLSKQDQVLLELYMEQLASDDDGDGLPHITSEPDATKEADDE